MNRQLTLYHMPSCPYCLKVRRYMEAHDMEIPLRDITADPAARGELKRVGGKVQVPCLFIDGTPLYESDDIITYLSTHVAS
ncbi:glutaredoxin family protein [Enorma phocaeensis]|uniref:Glutaredoxin n=1 Tax=Enorma phocaeensis TaxID=1871019 RepID=A0ABT7V9W0_9ACTN|nr:glutaredoxin [Enorma phocaeensis]MDM8275275.1 glutaredoxin [Enorma phocaeensis]